MRVKRFQAKDMPEALALIRADLGRDAVILHSEEVRGRGPFARLHRAHLEVVAAVDTDLTDFPRPTPAADQSVQRMQAELAALRLTLAQVAEARTQPGNVSRSIASLDHWYCRLLEQGVAAPLAQQVIQSAADELSRWALDNHDVLDEHLHWHLRRRLAIAEPLGMAPRSPTVFFLVGPSGVGKTATIAKLSANLSFAERARVLMITTDTFRAGAISQMTAYGQSLGLPVEVAYTPPQLAALVTAHQQCDIIMVDTPGRNCRAADQVAEVLRYVSAVPERVVHLALAAGAKVEDMRQTAQAFGAVTLDGLLFTKLDETATLGPAYTAACETGLPLSYLTTGLRVPEDIEVASAARLVDSMVGRMPDPGSGDTRRHGGNNGRSVALSTQEVG